MALKMPGADRTGALQRAELRGAMLPRGSRNELHGVRDVVIRATGAAGDDVFCPRFLGQARPMPCAKPPQFLRRRLGVVDGADVSTRSSCRLASSVASSTETSP